MIYLNKCTETDWSGGNAKTIYWAFDPEIKRSGTYLEPEVAERLLAGLLAVEFDPAAHLPFAAVTRN